MRREWADGEQAEETKPEGFALERIFNATKRMERLKF